MSFAFIRTNLNSFLPCAGASGGIRLFLEQAQRISAAPDCIFLRDFGIVESSHLLPSHAGRGALHRNLGHARVDWHWKTDFPISPRRASCFYQELL